MVMYRKTSWSRSWAGMSGGQSPPGVVVDGQVVHAGGMRCSWLSITTVVRGKPGGAVLATRMQSHA